MEETEEKIEFTIKNKPITFKFAIAFVVSSISLGLMMILLIVACKIYEKDKFIWFIEVMPAVALTLSILELFVYYKDEFSLKDGEFRVVKLFRKDIIFKSAIVDCVYMRNFGSKTQIEFTTKTTETVAKFMDDGTMLQDGIFLDALEKLQIRVQRNGYGNE